jgi:hypothetical protein
MHCCSSYRLTILCHLKTESNEGERDLLNSPEGEGVAMANRQVQLPDLGHGRGREQQVLNSSRQEHRVLCYERIRVAAIVSVALVVVPTAS